MCVRDAIESKHDVKIRYAALMITHTLLFVIKMTKIPCLMLLTRISLGLFCYEICVLHHTSASCCSSSACWRSRRAASARCARRAVSVRSDSASFCEKKGREKNEQVKKDERRKKKEA